MVNGLKKRSPFEMKHKMRTEHDLRAKEKRFELLLNQFRHISLETEEKGGHWASSDVDSGPFSPNGTAFSPFPGNSEEQIDEDTMQSSNNEDDWGEVSAEIIPKLDLRTLNLAMHGMPCPYCKENVLNHVSSRGNTNELKCACGFELKTMLNLDIMKLNLQSVVVEHSRACASGNSPNYSMFGPKAVVSCDTCGLNMVIN